MKTIIIFLAMVSCAFASPCNDEKKIFERAKKFGAHSFKCKDNYDGSAKSSWTMDSDGYKKFIESEMELHRKRIKGEKK